MNKDYDTPIFDCPLGYEVGLEDDFDPYYSDEEEYEYEDHSGYNESHFSVIEDWSRSSESNKERRIKTSRFKDRNNPWKNQYR